MRFIRTTSFRHILHEQKGGYILLPVLIMLSLSVIAVGLPWMESTMPALTRLASQAGWLVPGDPSMAQLLLGVIAGSCITVVSVVYSVLLIALTFASIQFSPRIMTIFLKDRVTQITLGIFIGTFAFCIILLPGIHAGASPRVPTLSITVGLLLATTCLLCLIFFIHHIALAIQVNYIVDRIARETERVLRTLFGPPLKGFPVDEEPLSEPVAGRTIFSTKSGYVQLVDEKRLLELAIRANATIYVHRGVGQFVPAGVPCFSITPFGAAGGDMKHECLSCFEIGPVRSMEDDVEFGILQMVDIALKAISPAVNDPSTAISCIDHLSAILVLAATLEPPSSRLVDAQGTIRLIRRQPSFVRLLEMAYNQITPYGKGDMAVSLRLMRALHDISGLTNYPAYLTAIRTQAQRISKACAACFPEADCTQLLERLAVIEKRRRGAS